MIQAGHGYTQHPCLYQLLSSLSPWTLSLGLGLGLAVTSLALFLVIQSIARRHSQAYRAATQHPQQPDPWSQITAMEKGKASPPSTVPPPASACDVLRPLSQSGAFPSSGAVAARAREQMQAGKASPSSPETSATQTRSTEASSEAGGPVQRHSELVQQMCEVDADGVRTWRRLIVEYS
ncbi:uncharacterized protein N7482_005805 [Penicillium canariense]|uniref:Uncharacterized protein n=1 Tax=Penicillium canariense TaxID=189055 RepID=A0A9W9I308_9EURO|nr:uncharacterized protein N7482_005805 [Penicillium canariense]KAJ5167024.1 hypothetical protein N7482_005805 [Penicillium canariense]